MSIGGQSPLWPSLGAGPVWLCKQRFIKSHTVRKTSHNEVAVLLKQTNVTGFNFGANFVYTTSPLPNILYIVGGLYRKFRVCFPTTI